MSVAAGTMSVVGAHARRTLRRRHMALLATSSNRHHHLHHVAKEQHRIGLRRYLSTSSSSLSSSQDTTASPSSATVKTVSMDELLALASCKPTALSLADMYRYAPNKRGSDNDTNNTNNSNNKKQRQQQEHFERLRNAQFLHRELPIRIAQRAVDLLTLPHGLNRTREVQSIANTYLRYLQQLQDFPTPTNADSERAFTLILEEFILDRHSIPMAISRGLRSLKDERKAPVDTRRMNEMEEALNRFFTARVGLRFLVEHHVLSGNGENSDDLYRKQLIAEGNGTLVDPGLLLTEKDVEYEEALSPRGNTASSSTSSDNEEVKCGAIQRDCDPVKEVRRTVARVTQLCRESYGIAPNIEIVVGTGERGEGVSFTYVPHHLRYMLAELLKNSCRASVRSFLSGASTQREDQTNHNNNADGEGNDAPPNLPPPIRVVVTKGAEDVTIKVCDRGGGLKRSKIKEIWSFAHSTEEGRTREDKYDFGKDEFVGSHIRGFGLPLARIYARYFGGEVTIKSMEGYGVDAYLYLPVLGVACENLPQRVVRSPGNLDSSPLPTLSTVDDGDDDAMILGGYDNISDDFFDDNIARKFDFSSMSDPITTANKKINPLLETLDERAL